MRQEPQSHHHLRRDGLDPHADDVAAPADHAARDRRRRGRRGASRRGDRPPARARSRRRASDAGPEVLPRVRCRHRAPLRRRDQLHDRRRRDDDDRGAAAAGAATEARGRLAQHGLDELRALSDAQALPDVQVRLGAALPRGIRGPHLQEHVQGHRVHPHLVRRQRHAFRDRVLRHRTPVHGRAFLRARHRQGRRSSSRACSGSSAASVRTRTTSRT